MDKANDRFGFVQAGKGDIRPILLSVLAERPMHGYQIIKHLEEKSHGIWKPSPGSVYPTLQLLEEQDLVQYKQINGKKIYTLTDSGLDEAAKHDITGPWQCDEDTFKHVAWVRDTANRMTELYRTIMHEQPDKLPEAQRALEAALDQLETFVPKTKDNKE